MIYVTASRYKIKGINFLVIDNEKYPSWKEKYKNLLEMWWDLKEKSMIPYVGVSKNLWNKRKDEIVKAAINTDNKYQQDIEKDFYWLTLNGVDILLKKGQTLQGLINNTREYCIQ